MSGLEVLGVVASTLQIAEIGMKLSVKLCSFYRQIKDADHSAQRLANDVSLTCSILNQLGKALEQDKETKLCSQQAFLTAQEVLGECEKIFKQVEETIEKKDPSSGRSKWERGTRKLTIVLLGPDLDVLESHLDRLKSTMLLMLNVIMYAREINRTSDHGSLEDQRMLIQTLLRERKENEARLEKAIEAAKTQSNCDNEFFPSSTLIAQPGVMLPQQPSPDNEIEKYHNLVETLLHEIDVFQSSLQKDRHIRIRDGMVNVHMAELAIFHQSHGPTAVRVFDSPFFKLRNQNLDRCSDSKPYDIILPEKAESMSGCSPTKKPDGLTRAWRKGRRPMPATRRASTGTLNLKNNDDLYKIKPDYLLFQPSREHLSPTHRSTHRRTPSPPSTDSDHDLIPDRHSARRRMYSTASASDTDSLDSRHYLRNRTGNGTNEHRVHPDYESPKKGGDIDDIDAYSYTPPGEQFDRDYPIRPRHRKAKYRLYQPISTINAEDNPQCLPRKARQHGPPPTAWGLDKIDRERPKGPTHSKYDPPDQHKPQDTVYDEALVAVPHDSDGEYPPYDRRRRHRRRYHHRSDSKTDMTRQDPESHHSKPHYRSLLPVQGLSTAALGGGYSDVSDYGYHRPSRHRHRRTYDECGKREDDLRNFKRESVVSGSSQHRYSSTDNSESDRDRDRDRDRSRARLTRGVRRERAWTSNDYSEMLGDGHTSELEETKGHDVKTPQIRDTRLPVLFYDGSSDEDDDKDDTPERPETPPIYEGATKESDSEKKVSHSGETEVSDDITMDTAESLLLYWTTLSRDMIQLEQES